MAIAGEVLQHRHPRLLAHAADQAFAAAGNGQVDVLGHVQQFIHRGAIGGGHQLDGVRRQTRFGGGRGQDFRDRRVAVAASLPPRRHGVAALDANACGVGGHVRPRLVDEEDHPQRHADLLHLQAVGPDRRGDHLAEGSGKAATSWRALLMAAIRGGQLQPIDSASVSPKLERPPSRADWLRSRPRAFGSRRAQGRSHVFRAGGPAQLDRGRFGPPGHVQTVEVQIGHPRRRAVDSPPRRGIEGVVQKRNSTGQ